MTRAEIFENRRDVGKKLCEQIRRNDGKMINAKNFFERPYYDCEKKYKFSTANYLRLMSSENIYVDPRWYKICDVEKNNWTLKSDAKFETLEEWQSEECLLTKFYNASEILEVEKFSPENKSLEEILANIEKSPDKIFESANKAQAILKNLRREKIFPTAESSTEEKFHDLEIIYHGGEIKNKDGFNYQPETILKGVAAYEFLLMLKSAEKQKIWLEFSYRDYAHGKFLISEKDFELLAEESVTDFLKNRLNENRQQILKNPPALKKYISPNVMILTEDIFNQINLELENFRSAMKNFEQEEIKYLQSG